MRSYAPIIRSLSKLRRIEDMILFRQPHTARYDITTLQIFNVHSKSDEKPAQITARDHKFKENSERLKLKQKKTMIEESL